MKVFTIRFTATLILFLTLANFLSFSNGHKDFKEKDLTKHFKVDNSYLNEYQFIDRNSEIPIYLTFSKSKFELSNLFLASDLFQSDFFKNLFQFNLQKEIFNNNAIKYLENEQLPFMLDRETSKYRFLNYDNSSDNLSSNDAGLTNFVQPIAPCQGTNPVEVRLVNYGSTPLTSLTINWLIDSIAQPSYNYVGNLGVGKSDTIFLGNFVISGNTRYNLKAYTSLPNGSLDVNTINDTINKSNFGGALQGIYTIGGLGSNYANISAAASDLKTKGICGPVVFNINRAASPYNEQIGLGIINGTSATNTIIFNGNGSTIRFDPTFVNRHIIKLDGTDYVTFDNFTIAVSDSAVYGWGVHLLNDANYNKISNSKIIMSKLSDIDNNSVGIAVTGSNQSLFIGANANYNEFSDNEIVGGIYGISIYSLNIAEQNIEHKIVRNKISDFRSSGIYIDKVNDMEISFNDISRPTRISPLKFIGILCKFSEYVTIQNNKIHDPFGTNRYSFYEATGIRVESFSNYCKIYNNLIYDFKSYGNQYGLYYESNTNVSFNTVSLIDTLSLFGSTYGAFSQFTFSAPSTPSTTNNIININRSGSGVHIGLNYGFIDPIISNNNLIYLTRNYGGTYFYGKWGSVNSNNLTNFQTVSSIEMGSLETNPLLTSSTILVPKVGSPVVNAGIPIAGIQNDFIGISRNLISPTIGAYETAREAVPPTINTKNLSGTYILTTRVLNNFANIFDVNGIDTSLANRPRLYYKKESENNTLGGNTSGVNGWKYVPANSAISPFSFTIDYALLSSTLTIGDKIQYFVVAQDLSSYPNVNLSSGFFKGVLSSVNLMSSNFPIVGNIKSFSIIPIPANNDMAILGFLNNSSSQCGDLQDSLGVIIFNAGLLPQTNFKITVSLTGVVNDTLSTFYTSILPGQNIDTVTLGKINTNVSGKVSLKAIIELATDADSTNNSTSMIANYFPTLIPPVVTGDSVCQGQSASLFANANGKPVKWYSSISDSNSIFEGSNFITPSLSASQTYYAETISPRGFNVGPLTNNIGPGGYNSFTSQTRFNVYKKLTIDSVSIYPGSAGTFIIQVFDSAFVLIGQTLPITINQTQIGKKTKVFVNINFEIGNNYAIRPLFNTLTAYVNYNFAYPYELPEVIAFTSFNGTQSLYGFFYDWKVSILGCGSDRIAVNAIVSPVANLGSDLISCGLQNFILDAGNPNSTFLWSTGDSTQIITVGSAGVYSVLVTNASGCTSRDTINIFGVNAADATFTSLQDTNSRFVSFIPNSASGTHEWNFGDFVGTSNLDSPIYNYLNNGIYTVTHIITSPDGCKDTATFVVNVTTPVGISNLQESAFSFSVFPNPIKPESKISYELMQSAWVELKIYDVLGRLVLFPINAFQKFGKQDYLFNSNTVTIGKGVYHAQLTINGRSESLKILVLE